MNWRNFESSGHRFNRKAKMQEILQESSKLLLVCSCNCFTEMWLWFTFKHHSKDTTKCPTSKKPDVSLPLSLKLCMQIIEYCWAQTSCSSFCFCRGEKFLFSCLPNNGLVIYNVFIFTKTSHFWWIWEFRSSSYLIRCCYRALLESLKTLA